MKQIYKTTKDLYLSGPLKRLPVWFW